MRPFRLVAFFVAFAFSALLPVEAWAWGCEGHQIVALIAEKHLSPNALAAVKKLLSENPIDPALKPYCNGIGDLFADAATWADDYRNVRLDTAGWHFIDIPRLAAEATAYQYCWPPHGCITAALEEQLKTLQTPGTDQKARAEALRFLIHFVGDIHQPLHATTNNDRGGNCVPVWYFEKAPQLTDSQQGNYSPNLHSIWDTDMLQRMMNRDMLKTDYKQALNDFAAELETKFHSQMNSWQGPSINFDHWAWESHEIAEQVAYGKLPNAIRPEAWKAVNSCVGANYVSGRMFAMNEQLGQQYQDAAAPVIQEQLAKAGARLAMLLNQIWP